MAKEMQIAVLDTENARVMIHKLTPSEAGAYKNADDESMDTLLETLEDRLGINIQNNEWMIGELDIIVNV